MAFPSTLDDFTPKTDNVNDVMAADVNELQTAIEALEAKVGIDASAVSSSLDYLIKSASNPGHTHTAYEPADATILKSAAIGVSIQAYDADLAAIAALTPADNDIVQRISGVWTNRTMAQLKTSLSLAKGDVGLGNVDNTSDATKAVLSATKWATARNLAGNSVDGSGNVAFANKFIVQGTADAGLSGAQFLGALGTGIVKNTTTTGVLSIAAAADIPDLSAYYVPKSLYDANTILYATTDNTPAALTVAASTIVGRKATGDIVALTATELRTIINVADGAEVNVNADWNAGSGDAQILNKPTLGTMAAETATNYVAKSLFDAYSVLYADTDNTPAALTVGANTVVGRIAAGIVAIAIDSDLSSVSANDDTIPSAKATKAYADLMIPKSIGSAAGDIIYWSGANTPARLAKGTDGQVLTLASGVPAWATPSSGESIKASISTAFETAARFAASGLNGTATFGDIGVTLATTTTSGRYEKLTMKLERTSDGKIYAGNPSFSCMFTGQINLGAIYIGLGSPSITSNNVPVYTDAHIGFKIAVDGAAMKLYATQADGTTENVSAALCTVATNDNLSVKAVVTSDTSVSYYYKLNDGAWSSATVLTSNIPAASLGSQFASFIASNLNNSSQVGLDLKSFQFTR